VRLLEICQDLIDDNVTYAEFRTGLKDLGSGLKGHLKAILRGIQKGTAATPLKVGLILSLRRDTNPALANQTINLALEYRDKGVVGIDLSGDSTVGDVKLKAGMINEPANHPALKLLLSGHPVSICTDDPLIFNTSLSEEYAKVALLTGLSPEQIEQTQKQTARSTIFNSLNHFFFKFPKL
jgi:adenosine deaminase